MIEISNLSFHYPDSDFQLAIDRLAVDSGQCAAIIGPSGCGKTTLLQLIAGINPNASGSIRVTGCEVHKMGEAERRLFRLRNIGFVFQDFGLIEYLNLLDNILHPYRINPGLNISKEARERAGMLADRMGIGDKLRRFVAQTSQGEQQRAAICRAIVAQPTVILADEPTGNLDPTNKSQIIGILKSYAREHEAVLLVATHDHELLGSFDRVVDFRSWAT